MAAQLPIRAADPGWVKAAARAAPLMAVPAVVVLRIWVDKVVAAPAADLAAVALVDQAVAAPVVACCSAFRKP